MRTAITNLLTRSNRQNVQLEVAEELQFHVDMLEGKYIQRGMSATHAKAAALKRFGNLDKIKKQCVDISRRNSLGRRILKTLTILIGLAGLSVHILASDYKVTRIGTMLIMIAIFGRLLLYVRGLVASTSPPQTNERFLR